MSLGKSKKYSCFIFGSLKFLKNLSDLCVRDLIWFWIGFGLSETDVFPDNLGVKDKFGELGRGWMGWGVFLESKIRIEVPGLGFGLVFGAKEL